VPEGPTIELLYFPECPNWEVAAQRLDEVAEALGVGVVRHIVGTDAEAERVGFRGSPTILIDGRDPFARGDEPVGLSCRVYRTPEGLAGAPTVEQLVAALAPIPHNAALLDRQHRQRVALGLAWATIAWNTVEAVVAIAAGAVASSIALVGFGLDSTVEVMSASVIVWQMTREVPEAREAKALRLIAISFFALAGYVTVQAAIDLLATSEPDTSTVGIVLAAVSLVVMPVLAGLKRRNGRRLGSNSVVADSRQTMLCTYLSAVLLVGLMLNAAVSWWWADPVAALIIAALAFKEGREAWRGEQCCDDDGCAA